jgi:hypothetical protein
MDWGDDDHGGLDDIFVPRDPYTGDPIPEWSVPAPAPRHRLTGRWWRCRRHRVG